MTLVSAAFIVLPLRAVAQDAEAGPDRFQAALTSGVSHTDNFYYQPVGKQSATSLVLQPDFKFKAETSKVLLDLTGSAQYGVSTAPGSKDDYIDRSAGINLGWTPTYRNRFYLGAGANHGHDPFGLARTEGSAAFGSGLDEWNHLSGNARYRYGSPSARVNAEVGASVLDVHYTTNREGDPLVASDGTKFLDFRNTAFSYSVFYNVTPKSALVLSFIRSSIDFDIPFDTNANGTTDAGDVDTRSGNLYQVRAGMRWLATAKTSGDVRAGYRQRTFHDVPGNFEGFDWEAGVQWSPTGPTVIEAKTARSEDESYRGDTTAIDVKANSLSLKRVVGPRARLALNLGQIRGAFLGAGRYDETRSAILDLEYAALSNVFLLGNIGYQTRDSTLANHDYHRLIGFIGLRVGQLR